ncbi:MAG: hypothetical protein H7328_08390 [Bdellovibrio sp.]|nr:hypothetical protein [Bdellovibrio sp.]
MEKIEIQKKLEKRKAYLICMIIFLGLFIPTFLSMTSRYGVSVPLQASFFFMILFVMAILYIKVQRIEAKISHLPK